MFSPLALVSSLALLAGSVAAVNHTVTVGGPAGLVFTPETVTAAVGDLVIFDFKAKAHTVTQSTFADPCKLMENGTVKGFDSGLVSNPDGSKNLTLVIEITQTTPLWVYCSPHCTKGMVMAINSVETGPKNLAAYKAASMGGASSNSTTGGAAASGASTGAAAATLTGSGGRGGASTAAGASGTAGAGAAGASASAGVGGTNIPSGSTTGAASSLATLSSILLVLPVAFGFLFL